MSKKAHQSKPYEQKVADRSAAKRAMRTGGDTNIPQKMRPDKPEGGGGQRSTRK